MAAFHVYVEGPIEETAQASERLARAMESRYGLPAAELLVRIAKGRFRVKANCDRLTADTYVRDLESIGARALIEEIEDHPTGATPRPSGQSTLPPAIARTGSKPEFASGLAAAFTADSPAADLGALSGAQFSLASLDGRPPTEPGLPAKLALSAAASGATVPLPGIEKFPANRFAPPEQSEVENPVELHTDEVADQQRRRASIPPVTQPPVTTSRTPGGTAYSPGTTVDDEMPRWRFAAGVVLALVLGFVPATITGGVRERSAYARIDRDLLAAQQAVVTAADYAGLDGLRAAALEQKHDERRAIGITSMLVWLAASAALAYVWFRRISWRDDRPPSS